MHMRNSVIECLMLVYMCLQVIAHDVDDSEDSDSKQDLSFTYLKWKLDNDKSRQDVNKLKDIQDSDTHRYINNVNPISNGSQIVPDCQSFILEFGKRAADFIKCSIDNARPFRFCEGCVVHYKRVLTIFGEIQQNDEKLDNCRGLLLNSDRVQVINSVQKDITKIWNSADCCKCFSGGITEDINGTVYFTLSGDTKQFLALYKNFTECLPNGFNMTFHNDTVCEMCHDYYHSMNTLFDKLLSLEAPETPHVCMDIVDMMNYSRLLWGDQLKCTIAHQNYISVVMTCVSLLIPLAFYTGMGVYGKKKERQYMDQKRLPLHSSQYASFDPSVDQDDMLNNSPLQSSLETP